MLVLLVEFEAGGVYLGGEKTLVTHTILRMAHSKVSEHVPESESPESTVMVGLSPIPGGPPLVEHPPVHLFYYIGHCLWALLCGIIGAVIAGAFRRSSEAAKVG